MPSTGYGKHGDNKVARLFWGRVHLEKASSLYFFNKGARLQVLLHALKYRNRPDIGVLLGKWLYEELCETHWFDDIDLLVPIPLHKHKEMKRGYNQAAIIGRGLSQASAIPLEEGLLQRQINSGSQTRLSRIARWENAGKAFAIENTNSIKDKHILLIDDVITTGATIEACADKLLGAGARVSALSVACAF